MTGQLSTLSALPGHRVKNTRKIKHTPTKKHPQHLNSSQRMKSPHRCCRLCLHTPDTHQPLSVTCTQLSPMHLTCPKQGTAAILWSVSTANQIQHGRAGKEPTLTSQVTRRVTIVPAETWVLPCSWMADP